MSLAPAMTVCKLEALPSRIEAGRRLLAFDPGGKRVGVALSDPRLTVATPLATLRRESFHSLARQIESLIALYDVGGFVMGLPLRLNGEEGRNCQSARDFAANIVNRFSLPLAFADERLSTAAVRRAQPGRKRRKRTQDDALAAAWILQGALERWRISGTSAPGVRLDSHGS